MLIAIAHFLGAIIAYVVFYFFVVFVAGKIQKKSIEELSVTLGLSLEELENEKHTQKIISLGTEKYSSEMFRNRISDFCGIIHMVWIWLVNVLLVVVLVIVLWYTFTDSKDNAVYSWLIPSVTISSWIISFIFSSTCHLLTGRYPGQAKAARKGITELLKQNTNSVIEDI
jgi:TRAP-type uncharacterized transport system fused permease subunit